MFSNVFEIVMASVISFLAAALCATEQFCYTALVSGGVVMILPVCLLLAYLVSADQIRDISS